MKDFMTEEGDMRLTDLTLAEAAKKIETKKEVKKEAKVEKTVAPKKSKKKAS